MSALRIDVPQGERAARVAWARLVEPQDKRALELIERLGAEGALHAVQPGDRLGQRVAPRLESLDVERDFEIAGSLGARIVVPGDDEWPTGFASLVAPPLCLWVRGPLELGRACERSVSVVGARAATQYGLRQAADISAGLVDRRFTVVSGAAYGIDGAAHRGALSAEGGTVAFTAGGIDRPYPRGHDDLFARLWHEGVVATEVPPGSAPTAVRFIARNRLIATVSQGTVVVEAGLRSGSLNTARTASGCHRSVAAMPGSVESPVSAGCHQLIRDGVATLVTDAAEVAELVGAYGELAPVKRGAVRDGDDCDAGHRAVHAALPVRKAVTVADLARRCGQSPHDVVSALGVLELSGLARRIPGEGWSKVTVRRG